VEFEQNYCLNSQVKREIQRLIEKEVRNRLEADQYAPKMGS